MSTCMECGNEANHEFFGSDGTIQQAELITTNSAHSWKKTLCHECWQAFQNRAFCTIERMGNVFTATCAF